MTSEPKHEMPEIVGKLAEAFSTQSKYSNQMWLALVFASAPIIFPNAANGTVTLPFSLGIVDESVFTSVGFLILYILTMAFCVAYAHAHIASHFAHDTIDKMRPSQQDFARHAYNVLTIATFARVSPLVTLGKNNNRSPGHIAVFHHVLLKVIAVGIILGLPFAALTTAYYRLAQSAIPIVRYIALLALLIPLHAMIKIAIAELSYAARVMRNFYLRTE